jgi:hypothetical protein
MDFKTKRRYRSRARFYYWMAMAMILLFVLTIVLAVTGVFPKGTNPLIPILMLILSVALGMGFTGMGNKYREKRIDYIRSIKLWKQYAFFHRVIALVIVGRFDKAVDTYNQENRGKSEIINDHLYAFISSAAIFSGNKKRKKKGLENLQKMLDYFDPAKVSFE